jgi:hypothetical protein
MVGSVAFSLVMVFYIVSFWKQHHPDVVSSTPALVRHDPDLPGLNKRIVDYTLANGPAIAPDYNDVVCTEFVIKVIDHFTPLDKTARKDIRIITEEDLEMLVRTDARVIKGVQTALIESGIGSEVKWKEVRPGDFVQFWSTSPFGAYGHCGIVESVVPGESLTLYSSHPATNGYGIHRFAWPEKVYFVRLNLQERKRQTLQ